jgi:glycogen operon protein
LNAHHDPIAFRLPAIGPQPQWELLLDTADVAAGDRFLPGGQEYDLRERSLAVLRLFHPKKGRANSQATKSKEN